MPRIDVVREVEVSTSARARQLEGMFDVPRAEKSRLEWHGEAPIDEKPWNVGLIVGPSGSGKSTIASQMFPGIVSQPLEWGGKSVIDDFAKALSMQQITEVCQAVGFNTIPAWLRPYDVLSTGEKFRVDMARRLLEIPDPIVVDEFTSVVDRQVAKIGSHAIQKYIRRQGRRFVAVTCHADVIDWLQPDWVLEPSSMTFAWRSLQRRPELACSVAPIPYAAWELFAPFHYLTKELHRGARCWGLFVGDRIAAFGGVLYRPHPKAKDIMGLSRLVTLPDWQGLGLAFHLVDRVAAIYKATGRRFNTYPAHPALVRSFNKSPNWKMTQKPGVLAKRTDSFIEGGALRFGGRPNAVFTYIGPAHFDRAEAQRVLSYWPAERERFMRGAK